MKDNSENPSRSREFQELAAVLGKHWGVDLELEVSLPIGDPPKEHRFDLASADGRAARREHGLRILSPRPRRGAPGD